MKKGNGVIQEPYIKPSDDFFEPRQRLKIKKHFDVSQIEKIVIRGIDPLGDMAIGTAFFREVRRFFPNAHILNLVSEHASQWMKNSPYIDEVRVFSKKEFWPAVKQLKAEKHDLIFLLTGNLRAGLMAYFAGIPNRIGYDSDGRGLLLTIQLHQELHSRYRAENLFDQLRVLGFSPQNVYKREAWLTEKNREDAVNALSHYGIDVNAELMAFNPFARDGMRRWDGKNWQNLLQQLQHKSVKPVMFVGPNETTLAKELLAEWSLGDIVIIEEDLMTTAAMLEYFDWVVGADSGFIHMALAVDKPHVIGIFGVMPPISCFPIHDAKHKAVIKSSLPCAPCYLYKGSDECFNGLKCMQELTADEVLIAMDDVRDH